MRNTRITLIIAGAVIILLITVFLNLQQTPDGAELFRREGCVNCHSFRGKGGSMAPDLTGVTKRRNRSWIRDQINDPKKHNPDSRMPSFGHLSRREVSALIKYFESGSQPAS
jgi:cbb3-type cytochrome oxidase cytochrome c subunit